MSTVAPVVAPVDYSVVDADSVTTKRAKIEINPEGKNIIDYYLWVSHGANVSANQNYYPIHTDFLSISIFSEPHKVITNDYLNKILDINTASSDVCQLLKGVCPKIPVVDVTNQKKKYVLLPPLFFEGHKPSGKEDRDATLNELIGLYYLRISQNMFTETEYFAYYDGIVPTSDVRNTHDFCKIAEKTKIISNNDMLQTGDMTYSIIFNLIAKDCKKKGLVMNDVPIGIYTCQEFDAGHLKDYKTQLYSAIPTVVEQVPPRRSSLFVESIADIPPNSYTTFYTIPVKDLPDITPITNIKHQGCGLTLLNYYNLASRADTREKIMCLPIDGTTVFSMIDLMNEAIPMNLKFIVIRSPIAQGIQAIYDYMKSFTAKNYTIFFKVYAKDTHSLSDGKTIANDRGHFVSFAMYDSVVYYVDPQAQIKQIIPENVNITDILQPGAALNRYSFIDIIFFTALENKILEIGMPALTKNDFERFLKYINGKIRTPVLRGGGSGSRRSRRPSRRITKRRRFGRNGRKLIGGELDTFQQRMMDIDAKNNIDTDLLNY